MCISIRDDQIIFRSIHHPYAFTNKGKKFSDAKSLNLRQNGNELVASVVWQRFAPTMPMVHSYGCRNSQKRNFTKKKERDVYCGCYALRVAEVREIKPSDGLVAANVEHKIEQGEIAHANLFATLDAHVDPEDIETAKTYFVDRLWRLMAGPCLHTCAEDTELVDDPRQKLPEGPLGAYADARGLVHRISDLIWYIVGKVLWFKTVREQVQEQS